MSVKVSYKFLEGEEWGKYSFESINQTSFQRAYNKYLQAEMQSTFDLHPRHEYPAEYDILRITHVASKLKLFEAISMLGCSPRLKEILNPKVLVGLSANSRETYAIFG